MNLPYQLLSEACYQDHGELTLPLAYVFDHLTAVDSNHQILDRLKDIIPKAIDFFPVESCILNVELRNNYYDLAVLSHSLYYIDSKEWLNTVKKTYSAVRK